MIIENTSIQNRADLRRYVVQLFSELGYKVGPKRAIKLRLARRTTAGILALNPLASCNRTFWVDCSSWDKPVSEAQIAEMKNIMDQLEISTGFALTKAPIPSQAHEWTHFSNIRILDVEELQHLYGWEWFRRQSETLDREIERLKRIYASHFDRHNPCSAYNNLAFSEKRLAARFEHFRSWVTVLISNAKPPSVCGYLASEPIQCACNPLTGDLDQPYQFASVRDYFRQMTAAIRQCADQFEAFQIKANAIQMRTNAGVNRTSSEQGERLLLEQAPIKLLESRLSRSEFDNLLNLVKSSVQKQTAPKQ